MSTKFRILARSDHSYCDLGTTLDLRAAQSLKEAMLRGLGKQRPMMMNASSVERLSTACIQLLVVCGAAFKEAGFSFALVNPSQTFSDAFADLGLQSELRQWAQED